MGIDALDITFRLEKRFGIKTSRDDLKAFENTDWSAFTAGFLHDLICEKLRQAKRPIPRSTWNGVRLDIARGIGISPLLIRREQRLIQDLGMS